MNKVKAKKPRPTCRFCLTSEAEVEAHIIPRSFIRSHADRGESSYILSNKQVFAARTWTGIYDGALLCSGCEMQFSEFDAYGYQFFFREQLQPLHDETGEVVAWQHPTADGGALKLFVLSLLWRASASSRQEFRAFNLGRWESSVKQMLQQRDPGSIERFPVMLERFNVSEQETVIMYPYQAKIGGTLCYKMEFAGCTAVVAIQGREWPELLLEVCLAAGRTATLFAKDYLTSQERARVIRIAAQYYRRHGRLPGTR